MTVKSVLASYFKLDGGGMFGVVPKSIWNKLNPSDKLNLCPWAMRSLLIESNNRKILVDTGFGNKQSDKFRSHFHPSGPSILQSLESESIHAEEITDVFLTHLHFDHVGGACYKDNNGIIQLSFPNATYWSSDMHYNWAFDPNPREAASFLKENFIPIKESGKLELLSVQKDDMDWIEGIKIRFLHGHTTAQMIPFIPMGSKQIGVYVADLMPSRWHVRLPYVMGYDMNATKTLEEKERLLQEAIEHDYQVFLEHDPEISCIKIVKSERGRYGYQTVS